MRYVKARSIEDAVSLLGATAVPMAGGTILVPEMIEQGRAGTVVDISGLNELRELAERDGHLHAGALVTLSQLCARTEVETRYRALHRAAATVGNPLVRRVGTVGGNIACRRPSANLPPALLVLDAEVIQVGPGGIESRPTGHVLSDGVPAGCLIVSVKVPRRGARRSASFQFAWRRASGPPIVHVAAALQMEDGVVLEARLAVGGLCRLAALLPRAQRLLEGRPMSTDLIDEAARIAAEDAVCDVVNPPREGYRRRLVAAGVRRALLEMTGHG